MSQVEQLLAMMEAIAGPIQRRFPRKLNKKRILPPLGLRNKKCLECGHKNKKCTCEVKND